MTHRLRSAVLGSLTAVAALTFAVAPAGAVPTGLATALAPACVDTAPEGSHNAPRLGTTSHLAMRAV